MNAQDILKYGDSFLLRTLDGLPTSLWNESGVCGIWSVKDIIAHLASYEHLLTDVLGGFAGSSQTGALQSLFENGSRFNDVEVESRHSLSAEDVLKEYQDAHRRNLDLAAQLAPETYRQVGSLPWYGAEYSLDDYIVYSFYGHKREHGAQIDVYKDKLKERDPW